MPAITKNFVIKPFYPVHRGRVAGILVGGHPCWIARGPSGLMFGPFAEENGAAGAVEEDRRECDADPSKAAPDGLPPLEDDEVIGVEPETEFSNEPNWPVFTLQFRDGRKKYVIAGPDGIEAGFYDDPRDAANQASELRSRYERGV